MRHVGFVVECGPPLAHQKFKTTARRRSSASAPNTIPGLPRTASGALLMNPSALKARRPTPEAALKSALKERKTRGNVPGKAAWLRP